MKKKTGNVVFAPQDFGRSMVDPGITESCHPLAKSKHLTICFKKAGILL